MNDQIDEHPVITADSMVGGGHALLRCSTLSALEFGWEKAIIFDKLHWMITFQADGRLIYGKTVNGHRWIFNTYEEWSKNCFPIFAPRTLMRLMTEMEAEGLIISCQPETGMSRRKYYRPNMTVYRARMNSRIASDHAEAIIPDDVDSDSLAEYAPNKNRSSFIASMAKGRFAGTSELVIPIEEEAKASPEPQEAKASPSTPKIHHSKQNPPKHTPQDSARAGVGGCAPPRGREEQRLLLKRPKNAPTEAEFDAFMASEDLCFLEAHYDFAHFDHDRWHIWDEKRNRFEKIYTWPHFIRGRCRKMEGAAMQSANRAKPITPPVKAIAATPPRPQPADASAFANAFRLE